MSIRSSVESLFWSSHQFAAKIKISIVLKGIQKQGYSRMKPFPIGKVEKRMLDFAYNNGIYISGNLLYISSKSIIHSRRQTKISKAIAVSEAELISFPTRRKQMELYYEISANMFIYLDRINKAKYVIHPSYEIKIGRLLSKKIVFVTATRIKSTCNYNKNNSCYIKI